MIHADAEADADWRKTMDRLLPSTPSLWHLPRTWGEFMLDPMRYRAHPQWEILSPPEYYGVTKLLAERDGVHQLWTWDPSAPISPVAPPTWRQVQGEALPPASSAISMASPPRGLTPLTKTLL